jgi:hypothetical protein
VVGDPESRLVKAGFAPKIRDLSIQDAQKNDYTKELLSNPYYIMVVVVYDLSKTDEDAIDRLNATAINLLQNFNVHTILLTANAPRDAEAFGKKHHLVSDIFYADGVPLKTMVRSNPGILLIKNGTVVNKWHYHSIPKYDKLVKQYFQHQ